MLHFAVLASGAARCLNMGASRPRCCTAPQLCASRPDAAAYVTTDCGLKSLDVELGRGGAVDIGSVVTIRYSGALLSRATRSVGVGVPEEPWQVDKRQETFVIGGGRSPLWEEAVTGMRVGGRRRILVPPSAVLRPLKKGKVVRVPEGDTAGFDCELCRVEAGATALLVRLGLWGQGSFAPAFVFVMLVNLGCYLWYGSVMLAEPASATVSTPAGSVAAERGAGCSAKRLLDSREQLDLAVQASSVQAWADAAEVAADPLLDGKQAQPSGIRTHEQRGPKAAAVWT